MVSAGARVACEGFLLCDKPVGWTSNRTLQEAKRRLNAAKGGHTGSLDPLATGLLPLCFGGATRIAQFLLEADKGYETVLQLGIETDTYDAEGRVTARSDVVVSEADIEAALAEFRGEILQVPPMYSAIKLAGQPLYRRARAGEEVARTPRRVIVRRLELRAFSGDRAEIEMVCSKGTYVRSLAFDLGRRLGCGAHVAGLRRVTVGAFSVAQAVSFAQLEEAVQSGHAQALLIPADQALTHLPSVHLPLSEARRIQLGQAVAVAAATEAGWVRVYQDPGRFLGIGWREEGGVLHPKRLLSVVQASVG